MSGFDKRQRMADYITRRATSTNTEPSESPARLSFAEWSRQAGTKPFVWPEPRPQPLGITTRLMATIYPWREIELEIGELFASVTFPRSIIRHPEPFGPNGLTDDCRAFIIAAVRDAFEKDGRHRSITWPDPSSRPSL